MTEIKQVQFVRTKDITWLEYLWLNKGSLLFLIATNILLYFLGLLTRLWIIFLIPFIIWVCFRSIIYVLLPNERKRVKVII
jgi:hypothetical protein